MKELIIVGGANGSGKTTFSEQIVKETGFDFLNADEIEKELIISKVGAGKIFFKRLAMLIQTGKSLIVESTLSGKYLAKVIDNAKGTGYVVKIVYIFLENPSDCIQRIKLRVELGGHFIPDVDVIRRYYRSKANFWNIYKNLAEEWIIIYNSATESPQKVAAGSFENYLVEYEILFNNFIQDILL